MIHYAICVSYFGVVLYRQWIWGKLVSNSREIDLINESIEGILSIKLLQWIFLTLAWKIFKNECFRIVEILYILVVVMCNSTSNSSTIEKDNLVKIQN